MPSTAAPAPPWDPEVLARIGTLHLRARQATAGLLHGAHRSHRVASNVEFADYKEYTPGDPLRDLDWKVAARSDRLVIRRHHAETELRATLILDASGDLGTGARGRYRLPPLDGTKFGYAVTLVATLAYYLHRHGEPVGLMILGGRGVRWPYMPPRSSPAHLAQIFAALASVSPAGKASLDKGIRELGTRIQRRSLVILVSDFMEEPAQWGQSLLALGRRRADVRAVHLYDKKEWGLDYPDPLRFFSPEGGDALPLDPSGAREAFAEVVSEYLLEVRSAMARTRAQHTLVASDEPLDRALAAVVGGA